MAKAKERVLVDVPPEIAERFDALCKALDKSTRVAGFIALIEIAESATKTSIPAKVEN